MNPPNGSKPFNLAAALAGEPVIMRDGRKIARLAFDTHPKVAPGKPLVAYMEDYPGGVGWLTRADGIHTVDGSESRNDLFMAPKTKKVWVNLYYDAHKKYVHTGGADWGTEAEAARFTDAGHLKTIEVEVPA